MPDLASAKLTLTKTQNRPNIPKYHCARPLSVLSSGTVASSRNLGRNSSLRPNEWEALGIFETCRPFSVLPSSIAVLLIGCIVAAAAAVDLIITGSKVAAAAVRPPLSLVWPAVNNIALPPLSRAENPNAKTDRRLPKTALCWSKEVMSHDSCYTSPAAARVYPHVYTTKGLPGANFCIKDRPRKARDPRPPPLHLVPLALSVARGCARMVVGGTAAVAVAVGCGDRAEVNREQTLDGKFDVKDERRVGCSRSQDAQATV